MAWTVDLVHLITSPHFYSDWLGFVGGLVGLSLLFISLVGVVLASPRFRWMLIGLWGGYVIYGLVLPFQMFTHSYYHLQLVPVVAMGLAPVAEAISVAGAPLGRVWRLLIVIPLAVGWLRFLGGALDLGGGGLQSAPRLWKTIGDAVPDNSDVIALTQDYGFDLMYWGWRKVRLWPLNTVCSALRSVIGNRPPDSRSRLRAAVFSRYSIRTAG